MNDRNLNLDIILNNMKAKSKEYSKTNIVKTLFKSTNLRNYLTKREYESQSTIILMLYSAALIQNLMKDLDYQVKITSGSLPAFARV